MLTFVRGWKKNEQVEDDVPKSEVCVLLLWNYITLKVSRGENHAHFKGKGNMYVTFKFYACHVDFALTMRIFKWYDDGGAKWNDKIKD